MVGRAERIHGGSYLRILICQYFKKKILICISKIRSSEWDRTEKLSNTIDQQGNKQKV